MKFKLNPHVFAVRQTLEELPRKLKEDAPTSRRSRMKGSHCHWNRGHITRLANQMFPAMLKDGVQFPIKMKDRVGLARYAEEAQLICFAESERGSITPQRRERLITALNRRYMQHIESQLQTTTPAQAAAATVVDNTANEMGQVVGAFLTSDPEHMKNFMKGLLTAFGTK